MNNVPVLSKNMHLTLFNSSNKLFFLINTPSFIAMFKEIAITEGIANPKAHGQELL